MKSLCSSLATVSMLVAVLFLGGCGGADSSSPLDVSGTGSASVGAPADQGSPVNASFATWWRNHGGSSGGTGTTTPPPPPPPTTGGDCTTVMNGYGTNGTYTMAYESFANPMWSGTGSYPVTVFYPKERTDAAPVMFFSHGYGGMDWTSYKSIITNLSTRGFVVVYSPYPKQLTPVQSNLDIMWNGFLLATQKYASRMDLSKVGFLGHSYGGGAVPSMARRALAQGWGSQGAFMYPMAPWYVYDMTPAQLTSFPANIKMIVQVYNEDVVNDHRMGMDIFNSTTSIPTTEKSYYNGLSGAVEPVGHTVPTNRELNQLDSNLVQKPLDALIDYAFNLGSCTAQAKSFALDGQGTLFQHTVTKTPASVVAQSTYSQQWSSSMNPRKAYASY